MGCWGQEAGGYGDGVGTGETGGDWIIEDSTFLHNTSDGLDLLYHTLGGSVTLNRVRAEGNAGNQIKVTGPITMANSVLVGNCAFFEDQLFTYWVDHCRALGSTLQIVYTGGEHVSIVNSTFYGQGDGLVGGGHVKVSSVMGRRTSAFGTVSLWLMPIILTHLTSRFSFTRRAAPVSSSTPITISPSTSRISSAASTEITRFLAATISAKTRDFQDRSPALNMA